MERIEVPASEARTARVRAGDRFRIVNVEGCQCVDFWAIAADDLTEWASAEHTRVELSRLFPVVGEHIYTNRRNRMMLFEEDNSAGTHDMLVAACDPPRFRNLGVEGWHPSCEENFFKTVSTLGWEYPFLPQSISWFTNIPVHPNGQFDWAPSPSKAGDYVTIKAEMDCDIIVCSCAQDIVPINCRNPTPLAIELIGSSESGQS
jgi:uncharacterized protein YcgI (DUF1989 family)